MPTPRYCVQIFVFLGNFGPECPPEPQRVSVNRPRFVIFRQPVAAFHAPPGFWYTQRAE
ncbi:hypothetical protein [Streptomyces sp. NPDC051098]|uniref:hypothetical protein n=1 Tax=Streptomyces sp. NPDC051098 TaxID=3155411 RepID=UPI00343A47F9